MNYLFVMSAQMYYILGHNECKFCGFAKELLDKHGEQYTYIDLKQQYPNDWKTVFAELKSVKFRTVPIIYRSATVDKETILTNLETDGVKSFNESSSSLLELVGGYFDLEEQYENITIPENY